MTALHMPTLVIALLVVSAALSVAVSLAAWGQAERDGLGSWGGGLALMTLGFFVFLWMGPQPWPAVGLALGNALLAASYATAMMALASFTKSHWPWWRLAAPVVLVAGLSWWLAEQDVTRVLVINSLFVVQWASLLLAAHRWRSAMPGRGHRVLLVGAVLVMGLYLLRIVALCAGHTEVARVFIPHAVQTVAYLLGLAGVVVLSVGYVLMSKERTDAEHVQQALIDGLTGVPNRKALLEQLRRTVAQAERDRAPLAVLMLDIDRFKRVNDTWGHGAGDAVLAAVAQCLKGGLRAQDFIGRYGGEEFVVVLPGTRAEGALTLAEHLRTRVERLVVPWEPEDIRVTISIGVHALTFPLSQHSPAQIQAVIDIADHAMYAAKQAGRNRVVAAGSEVDQRSEMPGGRGG